MIDLRSAAAIVRAVADELAAHFPGGTLSVDDSRALCVVPGRSHPATDGRLCRHHLDELGRWLHDIETEAKRLSYDPDDPDGWTAAPSVAIRYDTGGASSQLASQRSPANLDVIASSDPRTTAHGRLHIGPVCVRCPSLLGLRCTCPRRPWRRLAHFAACAQRDLHPSCVLITADRDERTIRGAQPGEEHRGDPEGERILTVLPVLEGWAQRVRDGRLLEVPVLHLVDRIPGVRWAGPVCALPCHHDTCTSMAWWRLIPEPPSIAAARKLLTRHLYTWIAWQPWVSDMRRELGELRHQLLRANHNTEDRPLAGHCIWLVDGEECGGDLWPAEPVYSAGYETDRDGPARPRAVKCGRNDAHRWEGRTELARLTLIVDRQLREDTAS